jgi:hypothetical protein
VLAAVNDLSRRRWRWPAAIIDCGCARCHLALRSGRRNGSSQTKKLMLDFLAAIRELLIMGLGLTRAAGVVCSGDGPLTTTSVLAATGVDWIIRRSRPIIAKVCAKKLSAESAEREAPDTAVPTHSTASRGPFATSGESSRYFNHPKIYKTHKLKIRAPLARVVVVLPHIAPPTEPCHG